MKLLLSNTTVAAALLLAPPLGFAQAKDQPGTAAQQPPAATAQAGTIPP